MWLGGFQPILNQITDDNFNWFLHVMLFYYTRHVLNKQADNDTEGGEDPEFETLD